jgi:hypothetical protein
VLRAVGFGLLTAVAVAVAHAEFVVWTENEFWWLSAILGAVVGLAVRLSKPELHHIWVRVIAIGLALLSLLLTEYLLVHYGDFESAWEDPFAFLFWGLSLLAAGQAAADNDSDDEEAEPSEGAKIVEDNPIGKGDPIVEGAESALDRADRAWLLGMQDDSRDDVQDSPASGQAPGSEPVWNPSTAVTGSGSYALMPPPGDGIGHRRAGPGRELHVGWVIVGVSIVAIAVGAVTVGVLQEWGVSGAGPLAHHTAGQPADQGAGEDTGALVDYVDLRVGDCVRDMQGKEADLGLDVVDCKSESHTDEVYGTFNLPRQRWPGEKRIEQLGWRGCDARFERYVGISVDYTYLDMYMASPAKSGWPNDRVVVCTVSNGPGSHLGSLRNANR